MAIYTLLREFMAVSADYEIRRHACIGGIITCNWECRCDTYTHYITWWGPGAAAALDMLWDTRNWKSLSKRKFRLLLSSQRNLTLNLCQRYEDDLYTMEKKKEKKKMEKCRFNLFLRPPCCYIPTTGRTEVSVYKRISKQRHLNCVN